MFVIPAIDLIDGKVVRLKGGDYEKKTEYSSDPLEVAKGFEAAGLTHLHLVDLDGAGGNGPVNLGVLERIASCTSLSIDYGGGIKTRSHLESALSAGAAEVSLGSIAVKKESEVVSWLDEYRGRLILSADAINGFIAVSGWKEKTSEDAVSFIKRYAAYGLNKVISTDISRDGMLSGPSYGLYDRIMSEVPSVSLIASGGISSGEDLIRLSERGLYGAIVGKAYYEGLISIEKMKEAENAC